MASRRFNQFQLTAIPQRVDLWANVRCPNNAGTITPVLQRWDPVTQDYSDIAAVGASAAVQAAAGGESGILSIVRTGVGAWEVQFGSGSPFNQSDVYRRMLDVSAGTTYNTTGVPTIIDAGVFTAVGAVKANAGFTNSNLVKIQLINRLGVAADPTADDVIVLQFTLSNSSSK